MIVSSGQHESRVAPKLVPNDGLKFLQYGGKRQHDISLMWQQMAAEFSPMCQQMAAWIFLSMATNGSHRDGWGTIKTLCLLAGE